MSHIVLSFHYKSEGTNLCQCMYQGQSNAFFFPNYSPSVYECRHVHVYMHYYMLLFVNLNLSSTDFKTHFYICVPIMLAGKKKIIIKSFNYIFLMILVVAIILKTYK